MVQREGAFTLCRVVHEAVVAEEAAGRVSDYDVAGGAGLLDPGFVEDQVGLDQGAAGGGDGKGVFGDGVAGAVVQDEGGGALGVPGVRGGVDQVGEAVPGSHSQLQEQAGGEAGGWAGVGLGFVAVGHCGVVDVGAEAAFGGVGGVEAFVADQAVEPAVGFAAVLEIVGEFGVALFDVEVGEVDAQGVVAGEVAEEALGDGGAV